jgi:thiol-disulfide isomerase/thioredoxin
MNPECGAMLRCLPGLLFLACSPLLAGEARDDWARVTELDAGPTDRPANPDEAATMILRHLERQEKALRGFLASHPGDANAFEANLRLARLLDRVAELKEQPRPAEAARILQSLEKDAATPARRTELDFALLSRRMRASQGRRPSADERRAILQQARAFEKAHPADRRIAALLAEVATLFDGEPATKEALLRDADKVVTDPVVKAQIDDDRKRLAFLGKPLPLRFDAFDGRPVDAKDWRGKVVAIIFFATWSEPSKAAFVELQEAVEKVGSNAQLVAVSLDAERTALESYVRERKARCPVAWAEKGWNSPLIRALGINALPSAWLLDRQGIVRSLDALDGPAAQIRRLLGSE